MPIFMDRHDVSETTTAENVAQLHQQDLKIQNQFGCRGLTYWFDDKRKTAFCLIEATDANAIIEMHNKAHGQVPHRVIEVDASIVESFLGRIEDPEKAKNAVLNIIDDPAFRTIMVIQLKLLSHKVNDKDLLISSADHYRDTISGILHDCEGSVVKQSENSFLVSFKSVSNGVHAALKIKAFLKGEDKNVRREKLGLKIALSAGVPVTEKKYIFEDVIKLTERMCSVVKSDITISSEVKELYNSENASALPEGKGLRCLTQADQTFLNDLFDSTERIWTNANLKIDDFSKSMGYSRSQLYRKLIFLTGLSPNSFVREYRLNEALKLLGRQTNNVSQIAFDTGFTSHSYFSKCFQKKYGYLPSDHPPH